MPKFPNFSARVAQIGGSVFEKFAAKIAAQGENLIKLHIGDTYLPPKFHLPIAEATRQRHRDFNRYCNTFGVKPLRDVLADKLNTDNHLPIGSQNILVTAGATNALSATVMSLVAPGEEVLLLSPFWPLFIGMVKVADGAPVEAPFYTELYENPDLDIAGYLEQFVTLKTVALYLNSPNNPSGKVLTRGQLEQIAEFARSHHLWVISDEAYDGLTFPGHPHISIASLPGLLEQTVSVFTFSKSFMFAGLRLGYLAGEDTVVKNINKIMVHQIYGASTIAQYMMVEPVQTRDQWLHEVQQHYLDLRDLFVEKLQIDFYTPEGAYFIFFPTEKYLSGCNYEQLVEACLDSGVSIAPGDAFGKDFTSWIRLCFTGESPQRLETGIERLNRIFTQGK
ncbi:MAG: pyridoxal phosphate-dependent aminotransferase [bacterium]